MMRFACALAICLLLAGTAPAAPAEPGNPDFSAEASSLEALLFSSRARLDSLQTLRAECVRRADELAGRIAALRRQAELNPSELSQSEHHTLEEHLRESQTLDARMREIDAGVRELVALHDGTLDQLVHAIQGEIDRTLREIEKADASARGPLGARVEMLASRKEAWERERILRRGDLPPPTRIVPDSTDSPRQLRIKGDMLLDQESAIRREMDQTEERLRSLREEHQIRQKVVELANEMQLFDEWEELLSRSPAASQQRGAAAELGTDTPVGPREGPPTEYGPPQEGGAGSLPPVFPPMPPAGVAGLTALPGISQAMNDPVPRSLEAIQDWIDRLTAYRDRQASLADSLHERSQWFYRQAEEKME